MSDRPFLKISSHAVTHTDFTRIILPVPWRGQSLCLTLEGAPVGGVPTLAVGDMILGYINEETGERITQRRPAEISLGAGESYGQGASDGYIDVRSTAAADVLLKISWV